MMRMVYLNGNTGPKEALHDEERNINETKKQNGSRRRHPLSPQVNDCPGWGWLLAVYSKSKLWPKIQS